jgi:hypothetical protein
LSGKGQGKLKLSGNGNECKPLVLGEAIYGANPVRAALLAKRRTVHHVWVQEEAGGLSREQALDRS